MSTRLTVEGCSGYFLNHQLLMEDSYHKVVQNQSYVLKGEVFKFSEKEATSEGEPRKRKRRTANAAPDVSAEEIFDVKHMQESVTKLLEVCPLRRLSISAADSIDVNAIVEEPTVFPKFHGQNPSTSPVVTTFVGRQFLIPPKSVFYNDDIRNLSNILPNGEKFDLIVLDPPWRNKYIRRLKAIRTELSYQMLYNEDLVAIPLDEYIHENTLVVIWCTNSNIHHKAILETFLPKWSLKLLAKWFWIKLNDRGSLVCPFRDIGQKQPFEHIFIATHQDNVGFHFQEEFLMSVASIIHSHKPPLFELFKKYLPANPRCLELFARYLYPGFTSVGLEVLKLQDIRLYDLQTKRPNE